jgi:UDP-N-acetylmuramoylalanine--D-glutamate ligase
MSVLVVGSGRSALGCVQLLSKRGIYGVVSSTESLSKQIQDVIRKHHWRFDTGAQDERLLQGVDEVIFSPGIPTSHPLASAARRLGLSVRSEVDVALKYAGERAFLAITGTNGKSTTTALCAHLLRNVGVPAVACGNIGLSVSEAVMTRPGDALIIELSSYQLEWCEPLSPKVAILTNLCADHLERHGTLEAYASIKFALLRDLPADSVAVTTAEAYKALRQVGLHLKGLPCKLITIDEQTVGGLSQWGIRARHDDYNAACAIKAAHAFSGVSETKLASGLKSFKGLQHRLEVIHQPEGAGRWINDSKSTNLSSVQAALSGLGHKCILLLGGQDKGESFEALLNYKHLFEDVFTFGEAAQKIADQLGPNTNATAFETMSQLMDYLLSSSLYPNIDVLLSPGCASFDEFVGFEDRGNYFSLRVREAFEAI